MTDEPGDLYRITLQRANVQHGGKVHSIGDTVFCTCAEALALVRSGRGHFAHTSDALRLAAELGTVGALRAASRVMM